MPIVIEEKTKLLNSIEWACSAAEFAKEAQDSDKENRPSLGNIGAIRATGLARAVMPGSLGGDDIPPLEFMQAMETISYADASVATVWNMSLGGVHYATVLPATPHMSSLLSDVRDNGALMCGGISAPSSELDTSRSGFRFLDNGADEFTISGRGGFATGCEASSYYFFFGAKITPDMKPGDPISDVVLAYTRLPHPAIKILYNWDAMGQRGTGSHDIEITNLSVRKEDCFTIPFQAFGAMAKKGNSDSSHRRYRTFVGILGCHIGTCTRAFDLLVAHLSKRRGTISVPGSAATAQTHSQTAWAQSRLGRLDVHLSATRSVAHRFAVELTLSGDDGQQTQRALARILLQSKLMMEEFTTGIPALGGAHGYVASSPLNLVLRDIIGYNAMLWRIDELLQTCGRAALGEEVFISGLGGT